MDKIVEVVPYNKDWFQEYTKIKARLEQVIPNFQIVHVGSTSIPDLPAKPIIDIDIVIKNINELSLLINQLAILGYEFEGDLGICGRYAFRKGLPDYYKHHLYVCLAESPAYLEHIIFKQYLYNHPDKKEQYGHLKMELARKYSSDINKYIEGKTAFINACLQDAGYKKKEYTSIMPNFSCSLINLTASIKKHFGASSQYATLPFVDDIISKYKHIVLVVLDGMGKAILENNLDENCFLRKHIKGYITSIFPPTTAAATTTLLSGLLPGETGWIGWQQYFDDVKRNVILFRNEDYYTGEKIERAIVEEKLHYEPFYKEFNDVIGQELYPSFKEIACETFADQCQKIAEITKGDKPTYTYAYWINPDALIHENGCYNNIVKTALQDLNDNLEKLSSQISEEASIIVTADHGLVDVQTINLNNFPEISQYLKQAPSLEGRCNSLVIENKEAFLQTFKKYFGSLFDIYSQAEFLSKGFLGNNYQKAIPYLGDFIIISKNKYDMTIKDERESFKAAHAGITTDEMIVPLITFTKNK